MIIGVRRTGMVLTIALSEDEVEEIRRAYPTSASDRERVAWEAVRDKYETIADLVVAELRQEEEAAK